MGQTKPRNAIAYCRISDARNGDVRGVRDQERQLRERAAQLGWDLARVIVENDTSAFKRRKVTLPDGSRAMRVVRPGWRAMLDDLASGRADGLLALDLDRACRDPRDLEDLVDVVEARTPRIPVQSITGSLTLATDADVTTARIMTAVANKESRDKARRVADARLRQAREGRNFGGGPRPFGYEDDRVTVRESEAAELVRAADALLQGVSLAQVAQGLRQRGVPTVGAQKWTPSGLRHLLLRPRNAGLVVHRGEILGGVDAAWEPILSRDVWDAVRALLTDPNRRTSPGNTPRWLGSGLYRCGHPDCIDADPALTLTVGGSVNGRHRTRRYRCLQQNLSRAAEPLDRYVTDVIVRRLARPDAVDLLTPPTPDVDTAALAREASAVRARIIEAGDLWEDGTLAAGEYRTRKQRLQDRLDDIEGQQRAAVGRHPLARIAGHPDAKGVWDELDLGEQRAVLAALIVVTVLPARRGRLPDGSRFDYAAVRIEPARPHTATGETVAADYIE